MPLAFNFDGKRDLPRVLGDVYSFAKLDATYTLNVANTEPDAAKAPAKKAVGKKPPVAKPAVTKVVIDSKKVVEAAWKYLQAHCANDETCNGYFTNLKNGKKLSLAACMKNTTFHIHALVPKTSTRSGATYTDADLPLANTAGTDIGLCIYALYDGHKDTSKLAATLLHEIAHFAGASTNTRGERNLDAEKALLSCKLGKHYNDLATG